MPSKIHKSAKFNNLSSVDYGSFTATIQTKFNSAADPDVINYFKNLQTVFFTDMNGITNKEFQTLVNAMYNKDEANSLANFNPQKALDNFVKRADPQVVAVFDKLVKGTITEAEFEALTKDLQTSGDDEEAQSKKKTAETTKKKITKKIKDDFIKDTSVQEFLRSAARSTKYKGFFDNKTLLNQVFLPYLYKILNQQIKGYDELFKSSQLQPLYGFLFEHATNKHLGKALKELFKKAGITRTSSFSAVGGKNAQEDQIIVLKPNQPVKNNGPLQSVINELNQINPAYVNTSVSTDEFYSNEAGEGPKKVSYGFQTKYNNLGKMDKVNQAFYRISNHSTMLHEYYQLIKDEHEGNIPSPPTFGDLSVMFDYLSNKSRIIAVLGPYNVGYFEQSGFVWTYELIENIMKNQQVFGFGYDGSTYTTGVGAISNRISHLNSYYHLSKFVVK